MDEKARKEIINTIVENGLVATSSDISELFTDLQSRLYQELLEAELEHHLKGSQDNKRNGYVKKERTVKTTAGVETTIHMPRDRKSDFEPVIIKKRQRVVDDFSDLAILLYSKGNTLEDIKDLIKQMYKIDLSKTFISDLISRVSEDVLRWQERELKPIYAMTYVDCLYCDVKIDSVCKKAAVYVVIGIDLKGQKEVIGIWIGDGSESASFWTGALLDIKERGVNDILYMSFDGLSGLSLSVESIFPLTKTQRCIVHIVRNLYKLCPKKDAKLIIGDFKKIYQATNLDESIIYYQEFLNQYENNKAIIKYVTNNIDHIYSLFSETEEIRRLIYTTNAIESVNSSLRKVTRGKGMFMNKESLTKVLYLRVQDLEKKWSKGTKSWGKILNDLIIQYGERIERYI